MGAFHTAKQQARRRVHANFGVAALYRAAPEATWLPVTVRIHERFVKMGDIPGLDTAHMLDVAPKAIFTVAELDPETTPKRGGIISLSAGVAWKIGAAEQPDGETVTASIAPLPVDQTTGFPVPGDA